MKKSIIAAAALVMGALTTFAAKPFNEVFPANFDNGLTPGWGVGQDATVENVPGGIKITCSQAAPNFRADLKYNMIAPVSNDAAYYYDINASEYKLIAIQFIGKRPESGVLKMSNIGIENDNIGWIKGKEGFSLNESGWTALTDLKGNTTYYWTVGGEKWTGNLTVKQMEFVIADIKNEADKSFSIAWVNWFKSEDDLKNALDLNAVVNQTTQAGFASLADAWTAAADGDVLYVKADQTVNKRLDCGTRSLTIEGADGVTITRDNAGQMLFLANKGADFNLTLKNLTLDGMSKDSEKNFIEASGASTVTLENVKITNAKSSDNLGLVVAKASGKLVINGLQFEDCTVPANLGEVFFGTNSSTVSGNNVMTISVEKNNHFAVEGTVTNTDPITIYNYGGEFVVGNTVVTNCTDDTKFVLGNTTRGLEAKDGNLVVSTTSGIDEIAADNEAAPVEYFNMQGIRVENPANGIFIRRQGSEVKKVVIR